MIPNCKRGTGIASSEFRAQSDCWTLDQTNAHTCSPMQSCKQSSSMASRSLWSYTIESSTLRCVSPVLWELDYRVPLVTPTHSVEVGWMRTRPSTTRRRLLHSEVPRKIVSTLRDRRAISPPSSDVLEMDVDKIGERYKELVTIQKVKMISVFPILLPKMSHRRAFCWRYRLVRWQIGNERIPLRRDNRDTLYIFFRLRSGKPLA